MHGRGYDVHRRGLVVNKSIVANPFNIVKSQIYFNEAFEQDNNLVAKHLCIVNLIIECSNWFGR